MANIARTKIDLINTISDAVTATALTTSYKYFDFAGKDDRTVVLFVASGATNVTIGAGDGLSAGEELVVAVPSGTSAIRLDSGAFKLLNDDEHDGANKGAIAMKAAATGVSVSIIELP